MNSTHLRRIIDTAITDLGYKAKHCTESVMVREGYFAGRQFRYSGVRAIWFAEEEVVKLVADTGQLLGTLAVADEPMMKRAA